jgi:beclin 1
MEINAALGQAMLVVSIIAARAGMRFRHYTLHPFGSFSKVSKNDDRRVMYPLFMDPTLFSLFPKSKFHPAMFGFLCCIKELGDYISAHGKSLPKSR